MFIPVATKYIDHIATSMCDELRYSLVSSATIKIQGEGCVPRHTLMARDPDGSVSLSCQSLGMNKLSIMINQGIG